MSGRRAAPDEDAFRAYAAARSTSLHRSALLLTGDRGLAEDLVQTVLIKLFQHWGRVSATDNIDAYVRRMLVNTHLSQHRRRRWRELSTAHPPDTAAVMPVYPFEDHDRLRTALAGLPARQRAAVVLRHYQGLTETETAAALETSIGNVKSLTSRGLASLRAHLTDMDQDARTTERSGA